MAGEDSHVWQGVWMVGGGLCGRGVRGRGYAWQENAFLFCSKIASFDENISRNRKINISVEIFLNGAELFFEFSDIFL